VIKTYSGIPGAVHDVTIATDNQTSLRELITRHQKVGEELKVFADKGFIGCESYLPIMTPYKKKPNKDLTEVQMKYNKDLANHRVICERWYGRLKSLFRIIATEYHNDREEYEFFFRLCAALTNYHILKHPL